MPDDALSRLRHRQCRMIGPIDVASILYIISRMLRGGRDLWLKASRNAAIAPRAHLYGHIFSAFRDKPLFTHIDGPRRQYTKFHK